MQNNVKRYFYREKGKQIWEVGYEEDICGPWEFSFDKKKIYNLWTDYWDLSDEQREIFDREFPEMAALKNPNVVVPEYENEDNDEDEEDEEETEYDYEYSE